MAGDGVAGHTIGVVLAIPSPVREQIDAARGRFDPSSSDLPAHVTVLAPIDVDADAMPVVESHLAAVARATAPFTVVLRGTGTFRPVSPVVFIRVVDGAAECARLEQCVRSGDMAVDARYAYHPHVTIAHDVPDEVLDEAECELSGFEAAVDVASMGWYEHIDGVWRPVREFPFTGA